MAKNRLKETTAEAREITSGFPAGTPHNNVTTLLSSRWQTSGPNRVKKTVWIGDRLVWIKTRLMCRSTGTTVLRCIFI